MSVAVNKIEYDNTVNMAVPTNNGMCQANGVPTLHQSDASVRRVFNAIPNPEFETMYRAQHPNWQYIPANNVDRTCTENKK